VTFDRLIVAAGGLFGASGIALLAFAAHGESAPLDYAAIIMLGHAVGLIAIAAAARAGLADLMLARVAALDLGVGALLFSGDVTIRALTGGGLFPMAAPTGGFLCIAGWLLVAVAALVVMRRKPG
jgi:uncharacterized membrane protein YgdD (TMEM256/DUF423 family)